MASSEEVSSSEGVEQSQAPSDVGGFSPSSPATLNSADHERLRERVAEARMRTMELISRCLELEANRVESDAIALDEGARAKDDRPALSASVKRYATLLRTCGEPPERALVLIKTAFSEAAPRPDASHRSMLEEVVRWAVDAYFDG